MGANFKILKMSELGCKGRFFDLRKKRNLDFVYPSGARLFNSSLNSCFTGILGKKDKFEAGMKITALELSDLEFVQPLQPPGWSDIRLRCETYIYSPTHTALKATLDDRLVGLGTTILHDDSAWLASIITHPRYRAQGIGTKLTRALIDTLDPLRFSTVYLDATDLGYPVYKKIGFTEEIEYFHYKEISLGLNTEDSGIRPYEPSFLEDILKLDRKVSGEERSRMLIPHIQSSFVCIDDNRLTGAFIPGLMEGLVIARDCHAGIELMKKRFTSFNYTAIPASNRKANEFLTGLGYERFRRSRRMRLWKARDWKPEMLYSRVSGQLG
jgi:GNAT superfamily N-acetyltransferase